MDFTQGRNGCVKLDALYKTKKIIAHYVIWMLGRKRHVNPILHGLFDLRILHEGGKNAPLYNS